MTDYSHVTIMLSMPRSRSAWMVEFMRPGCSLVLHDPLRLCNEPADLRAMIDAAPPGKVFIADTGAMLFYDALKTLLPGVNFFAVHRDFGHVFRSLQGLGIASLQTNMRLYAVLRDVIYRDQFEPYEYTSLTPRVLATLYWLVTDQFPPCDYVIDADAKNIQINIAQRQREIRDNPTTIMQHANWRS